MKRKKYFIRTAFAGQRKHQVASAAAKAEKLQSILLI
jgi:hypothetical protein